MKSNAGATRRGRVRRHVAASAMLVVCLVGVYSSRQGTMARPATVRDGEDSAVSFKQDIMPIIEHYCLPCHAEENYNPSELSLDSYDLLMSGGKHGKPVLPGNPKESILSLKLRAEPPFGHPMPLKKKSDPEQHFLSPESVQAIDRWIDQGARNN